MPCRKSIQLKLDSHLSIGYNPARESAIEKDDRQQFASMCIKLLPTIA
jgi:hypothetical protein